uniref:Ig-like domain-containing protein n=1 Tax=Oreochromis aureus TaxID=47969 RepID=A0AAZ1X1K9_OREAU
MFYIRYYVLFLFDVCLTGSSLSHQVSQTPANIYTEGEEAKIYCWHSNPSYDQILWYKKSEKQLQLLGYMYYDKSYPEPGVNITMDGDNCTLTIKDLKVSSSGVYFCAASYHKATSLKKKKKSTSNNNNIVDFYSALKEKRTLQKKKTCSEDVD